MLRRTAVLAGAGLLAGLLAGCADNGSIDLNSIGAQVQQGVDSARGAVDTAKAKAEELGAAGDRCRRRDRAGDDRDQPGS